MQELMSRRPNRTADVSRKRYPAYLSSDGQQVFKRRTVQNDSSVGNDLPVNLRSDLPSATLRSCRKLLFRTRRHVRLFSKESWERLRSSIEKSWIMALAHASKFQLSKPMVQNALDTLRAMVQLKQISFCQENYTQLANEIDKLSEDRICHGNDVPEARRPMGEGISPNTTPRQNERQAMWAEQELCRLTTQVDAIIISYR